MAFFYFRPHPCSEASSVGIGTSDYLADSTDASTQGGPPQLDLSSFLQELLLTGMSSPVIRAPVSALSPVLRRSLTVASPPPVRVTLCQGTTTRDELEYVEMATDTGIINVDKAVQAVVEYCDVSTEYDRLGVTSPVLPPADSVESVADPPEDFSVVDSLDADSSPEPIAPESDSVPLVTSPMGTSPVDSDDEAIATRLPGHINSFKPREVFVQQFFIRFSLSIPYIFFCSA